MKLTKQQLKQIIKEELQESDRPYDAGKNSNQENVVHILQDETDKILLVFKHAEDAKTYQTALAARGKKVKVSIFEVVG